MSFEDSMREINADIDRQRGDLAPTWRLEFLASCRQLGGSCNSWSGVQLASIVTGPSALVPLKLR